MKARINIDYQYDHADIAQLTKHYKLQNTDPNIIWGEAIGVNADQRVLADGDYSLKQAFEELQPGQKLLLPLNLENTFHWVGLIIEKDASGKILATSMDSLPSASHEEEINLALELIWSKTGGNIERLQPKTDVLIQPDSTSCGPYTLQNLIQQSSSSSAKYTDKENKITVREKIRKGQIVLAGDSFAEKQELNFADKTISADETEKWDEITGIQMAIIDSLDSEIKREDGRRSPISVASPELEKKPMIAMGYGVSLDEDIKEAMIEIKNKLGKKIRQGYFDRIVNVFKKGGWAKNDQIIIDQELMRKKKSNMALEIKQGSKRGR